MGSYIVGIKVYILIIKIKPKFALSDLVFFYFYDDYFIYNRNSGLNINKKKDINSFLNKKSHINSTFIITFVKKNNV